MTAQIAFLFTNLNVIRKNPSFFFHSSERQNSFIAKVIEDGIVDDINTGKVTSNGQTEVTIVSHVITVL